MKMTSTIFRNSPGCTLTGPRLIHSRAPFTSYPMTRVATSRKIPIAAHVYL